jgi:hypothetical protein
MTSDRHDGPRRLRRRAPYADRLREGEGGQSREKASDARKFEQFETDVEYSRRPPRGGLNPSICPFSFFLDVTFSPSPLLSASHPPLQFTFFPPSSFRQYIALFIFYFRSREVARSRSTCRTGSSTTRRRHCTTATRRRSPTKLWLLFLVRKREREGGVK